VGRGSGTADMRASGGGPWDGGGNGGFARVMNSDRFPLFARGLEVRKRRGAAKGAAMHSRGGGFTLPVEFRLHHMH
jgi:hypothetical protein